MPATKQSPQEMTATIREFRAAPAKLLRRAARTGAKLRLGAFVLIVREEPGATAPAGLYGAMAATVGLVGDPSGWLSTGDVWDMDK
jgi:hypothetical protein